MDHFCVLAVTDLCFHMESYVFTFFFSNLVVLFNYFPSPVVSLESHRNRLYIYFLHSHSHTSTQKIAITFPLSCTVLSFNLNIPSSYSEYIFQSITTLLTILKRPIRTSIVVTFTSTTYSLV